jgi:acyl carrier protein
MADIGSIPDRIRRVMANALRVNESAITDSLRINGIPTWNSLGHMSLVVALEKEFGIRISGAKVASLTSFEAIVREMTNLIRS